MGFQGNSPRGAPSVHIHGDARARARARASEHVALRIRAAFLPGKGGKKNFFEERFCSWLTRPRGPFHEPLRWLRADTSNPCIIPLDTSYLNTEL